MAENKRIVVSLPDTLLKEVDNIAFIECRNRSEFVRNAMRFYIKELKKISTMEKMKRGYLEMAEINKTLAELGVTADNETFMGYELRLAECE